MVIYDFLKIKVFFLFLKLNVLRNVFEQSFVVASKLFVNPLTANVPII